MRAILLLVAVALSAGAADREFNEIVQAISDRYHTRPTHIPLFGLVNAFTFVARPAGTSHIDLAVFEDLREGTMDPAEIRRIVGGNWKPFVQVHSRRNHEVTLIYLRPEGRDHRMLITSLERHEATVVQLKLNMDAMRKWLDDPAHGNWKSGHGEN